MGSAGAGGLPRRWRRHAPARVAATTPSLRRDRPPRDRAPFARPRRSPARGGRRCRCAARRPAAGRPRPTRGRRRGRSARPRRRAPRWSAGRRSSCTPARARAASRARRASGWCSRSGCAESAPPARRAGRHSRGGVHQRGANLGQVAAHAAEGGESQMPWDPDAARLDPARPQALADVAGPDVLQAADAEVRAVDPRESVRRTSAQPMPRLSISRCTRTLSTSARSRTGR